MTPGEDSRSLGELFADLARDMATLVRQEIRQAGIETSQRVASAGRDVGVLVAGAVVAHTAFLVLVAAFVLALGELGMPWWLSALIVALLLAGAGAALILRARAALKRADILPRHTIEQAKEDQEWITQQVQ